MSAPKPYFFLGFVGGPVQPGTPKITDHWRSSSIASRMWFKVVSTVLMRCSRAVMRVQSAAPESLCCSAVGGRGVARARAQRTEWQPRRRRGVEREGADDEREHNVGGED